MYTQFVLGILAASCCVQCTREGKFREKTASTVKVVKVCRKAILQGCLGLRKKKGAQRYTHGSLASLLLIEPQIFTSNFYFQSALDCEKIKRALCTHTQALKKIRVCVFSRTERRVRRWNVYMNAGGIVTSFFLFFSYAERKKSRKTTVEYIYMCKP